MCCVGGCSGFVRIRETARERESDYFCQLRRTISGRERDRGVDQAMRERFENV